MLNWDDYNVAEGESQAATQQQTPVQQEVVNKALETLVETPAAAAATSQVQAAAAAIANIDTTQGLAELEMGGARISVDEKAMINCRADLNQLVPFKYDWAW